MPSLLKRSFHPVLLSLYPIFFLYSQNSDITPFMTALWPMLISLSGAMALWFLFNLTLKDPPRSAIFVSLLIFLFFAAGHVHTQLHLFILEKGIHIGHRHHAELLLKLRLSIGIGVIWLAIAGLSFWKLRKARPGTVKMLTSALNTMAIVLLALPVVTLVMAVTTHEPSSVQQVDEAVDDDSGLVGELGYKPDIYDIILDGYGREDILREFWSFENREFLQSLEDMGFLVASRSRSNYNWTELSLASYLNMEYVNHLTEEMGTDSRNRSRYYLMTRNNEVSRFLRSRSYRYVHLRSTWGSTYTNRFADEEIPCGDGLFQVEFYRVLAESSLLKLFESPLGVSLAECHLSNLETLENIAPAKGPKFVFAHFVPPHHPYVFDRDGNILREASVSNQFDFREKLWTDKASYIDQVQYMNKRIRGVIEAILARSDRPPIIFLHSDHGPQLVSSGDPRPEERSPDYHRCRYSTLAAFYLPGASDGVIPRDITLVNAYRVIFNEYFDAGFEVLENRFYSTLANRLFDFTEMTLD